jgi:putative ABC transport system permease protein
MRVLRAAGEAGSPTKHGGAGAILAGLNIRGLLLVGQIALSIVLLIGATLLIESVSRLRGVRVGFNAAHLLTMQLSLPPVRYDTTQKRVSFFQELVRQVRSSPGIRSATAAMSLPMIGYAGTPVQDASKPLLKLNERLIATYMPVMPAYFRTLEIPLRRGRDFTEHDAADAERVAIIDEALARRFWPEYPNGLDPVGQRIWVGGLNPKPAQIVGVAADVHQNLESSAWPETVYVSFAQNPLPSAMLAVRTDGDPLRFTGAVRERVRVLDKDQAVSAVHSMDDLVEEQMGQRRLLVMLLGSFAGVALLLALIGIYGAIAYSVAQRTREMGIRRALGAQHGDILRLVAMQGFRLALAGVAAGLVGAYGLTRLMESVLFHVSAADPATFAGVGSAFLFVALAASYIPARRATQIDPMAALRIY